MLVDGSDAKRVGGEGWSCGIDDGKGGSEGGSLVDKKEKTQKIGLVPWPDVQMDRNRVDRL